LFKVASAGIEDAKPKISPVARRHFIYSSSELDGGGVIVFKSAP